MKRAVRKIAAAAVGLAAAMLLVAPANAVPMPEKASAVPQVGDRLVLPKPTGPHPVGREVLHLVDQSRTDPWVPTGPRELMVSVWYPAATERGKRVPYATAEESRLLLEIAGISNVPPDTLTRVLPHARAGAPPKRTNRRLPLVAVSPGFGDPRWMLTTLAEDLASRGYIVVGVDHTHEGSGITFPDGRVTGCLICERVTDNTEIVANRAQDISFVLDRLLGHTTYGRTIDHDRIGVVGHSMGGAAAAGTMLADRRVDAGVNMDGLFQQALDPELDRPFLMMAANLDLQNAHTDWNAAWEHLTGWRRWLNVPQAEHYSYTDAAFWGPPLVDVTVGELSGARSVEITRTYVAAFFDQHLRNRRSSLLKRPSPRFPGVHFVDPTTE